MKSVLVTGASGFVGTHLVEHLLSRKKYHVFGTHYGKDVGYLRDLLPKNNIFGINLLDKKDTRKVVDKVRPDYVYHLAALSSPAKSFEDPQGTIVNNVGAQLNLFDACLNLKTRPRTLVVGSAEEYGLAPSREAIDEEAELNPLNAYAVSKISQDYLGLMYYLTHKLPIVRVRPFNHTGERRPPVFVLPAFAKQVAEIELGIRKTLLVRGDLSVVRDFTDVKDMVRAYELAVTECNLGEVYNLGSGRPTKIGELLELLKKNSTFRIVVERDKKKLRPADVRYLVCNADKFKKETGWKPEIDLEVTVGRVLNYWREQVKGKE